MRDWWQSYQASVRHQQAAQMVLIERTFDEPRTWEHPEHEEVWRDCPDHEVPNLMLWTGRAHTLVLLLKEDRAVIEGIG